MSFYYPNLYSMILDILEKDTFRHLFPLFVFLILGAIFLIIRTRSETFFMVCLLAANLMLLKILTPMNVEDIFVLVLFLTLFFFSVSIKRLFSVVNIFFFLFFMAFWIAYKYYPNLLELKSQSTLGFNLVIVGLSYLGFKLIHFYVDFRKDSVSTGDIFYFLNWCLFFPTVLAGPMMRYQAWRSQIIATKTTSGNISYGLERILVGLFMKLVLANNLYNYTLSAIAAESQVESLTISLIFSALIYPIYLFFDFAGYTHIAIGTALMLGVKLPENFIKPLFTRNIIQFWREWHITLSELLRDYLFLPISVFLARNNLGGKTTKILVPTLITFALAGVWHGAGLNFLIFGIVHGLGIAFVRLFDNQLSRLKLPYLLAWSFNYIFLSFSFVFFDLDTSQIIQLLT